MKPILLPCATAFLLASFRLLANWPGSWHIFFRTLFNFPLWATIVLYVLVVIYDVVVQSSYYRYINAPRVTVAPPVPQVLTSVPRYHAQPPSADITQRSPRLPPYHV